MDKDVVIGWNSYIIGIPIGTISVLITEIFSSGLMMIFSFIIGLMLGSIEKQRLLKIANFSLGAFFGVVIFKEFSIIKKPVLFLEVKVMLCLILGAITFMILKKIFSVK